MNHQILINPVRALSNLARIAAVFLAITLFCALPARAQTYTFSGAQTGMMPATAIHNSTVVFNTTSGYFGNGSPQTNVWTNANITVTALVLNNGYGTDVTVFTNDTVTGAGAMTLTSSTYDAQDFVFAGNMTGYSGNVTLSTYNLGFSQTLGLNTSGIFQFGGTTIGGTPAQGSVSVDGNSLNYINNVTGSGTISVDNLVLNYATNAAYNYLAVNNTTITTYAGVANLGSANLVVSGVLAGSGAQLLQAGSGTLTLSGANTYGGATIVKNGTLTVNGSTASGSAVTVTNATLNGTGTIGGSVTITNGGLVNANGTINGTVTVNAGAVLNGNGIIKGAVTVNGGGTLGAGTAAAIGTLSISNGLTLNATSTNVMRLQKTGAAITNDLIQGLTTVGYNGTLVVTTNAGSPLAINDTFTLFQSAAYSGSFGALVLPALPTGWAWDTSQLGVNGSIRVISGTAQPIFSPTAGGYVGGLSVTISGAAGTTIYYTTNGTTPTMASPSGPTPITGLTIPVGTTETINAFASNSVSGLSTVATAVYTTVPTAIWTNTAGGSWQLPANWNVGAIGSGSGVTADFSELTLTGATTVSLAAGVTIGNLLFADQGAANNWTVSGSASLTLNSGALVPVINVSNQTATISAPLAGTNGLVATGAGTLVLSGANTYTGTTTISNGTVEITGQSNLGGGGAINISANGTLAGTFSTSTATLSNNITGSGALLGNGSGNVVLTGTNTHSGVATVTSGYLVFDTLSSVSSAESIVLNGGNLALGGAFVGQTASIANLTGNSSGSFVSSRFETTTGTKTLAVNPTTNGVFAGYLEAGGGSRYLALTKNGPATLTLTGPNAYVGPTTVNGGTLEIASPGVLGGTAVTVTTNTVLACNSTIAGPVTIQPGGSLIPTTVTTSNAIGTLTISSNLTLNGNITFRISVDSGVAADEILGLTSVTYGGTLIVTNITTDTNATPLAAGNTFYLFSSATHSGAFTHYVLPALPSGLNWDLSGLPTSGSIQVVALPPVAIPPTFSPAAGNYAGALSVTITSINAGGPTTIYYTTDGTTPTATSPSGTSPVTVTVPGGTNLTIQAYASATGYTDSSVASADYVTIPTPIWVAGSGGSWPVSGNWSNNIVANGSGIIADISQLTLTATNTITLDSAVTVGGLLFADQGNLYPWIVNAGTGGTLKLDATNPPLINVANQSAAINVALTGTNGMVLTGPGTLTLSADAPSLTGGITVNSGTLRVTTDNFGGKFTPSLITINTNGTLLGDQVHALGVYSTEVINHGTWVMNDEDYTANLTMMDGQINVGPNTDGGGLRLGYFTNSVITVTNSVAGSVINISLATYASSGASPVTNTLNVARGAAVSDLTVNGPVISNGGLVKTGNGILTFNGTNTYTGATIVSNGTLVVNGIGGAGATTVAAGATLTGTGVVRGSVTNNGTLAPGAGGLGTLTISNTLTLTSGSTTTLAINRTSGTANYGKVQGVTSAVLGGTLTVTNLGGTFQAGDTFTLFNASSYTGNFTATNLPALASGLTWNWEPAAGALAVVSTVNLSPTNVTATASGSTLTLTWPADHTGWRLQVQTNNLPAGISGNPADWGTVGGSQTTNQLSLPINSTLPAEFYRLVYP